jgi:hypothetical protein
MPVPVPVGSGIRWLPNIRTQIAIPMFDIEPLPIRVTTTEFEFEKPEHDAEHVVFEFEGDPLFDEGSKQRAVVYAGDVGPVFDEERNTEILLDDDHDIERAFKVV